MTVVHLHWVVVAAAAAVDSVLEPRVDYFPATNSEPTEELDATRDSGQTYSDSQPMDPAH